MDVPGLGNMPVIMFTAEETDHTFDVGLIISCIAEADHSTACQDNGTTGNMNDDYFDLTVTGTIIDGSGSYVVSVDGMTFGTATDFGQSDHVSWRRPGHESYFTGGRYLYLHDTRSRCQQSGMLYRIHDRSG